MTKEQKETPAGTGIPRVELQAIFKGSERSVAEMNKIFEAHKDLDTVIVNPDSWIGKELLSQTGRIIDLRHDVYCLERKVDQLIKLFREA